MSPELIQLGQQALSAVASGVARGAPLVKCQLLASQFYEALRSELRESSQADVARRKMLIAAVNQCHRTAIASTTPAAMLQELRSAIDLLQADMPLPEIQRPRLRPALRVIEGGLSRNLAQPARS
jgi:hypothetical protein